MSPPLVIRCTGWESAQTSFPFRIRLLRGGPDGVREWNARRGNDEAIPSLIEADLRGADLREAYLGGANLGGADLTSVVCSGITFANADLSETKGLESAVHRGPSTIGIDTVIKSKGKIPEAFLRGCGVPDVWITNIPALIGGMQPIQFYSVFRVPTRFLRKYPLRRGVVSLNYAQSACFIGFAVFQSGLRKRPSF